MFFVGRYDRQRNVFGSMTNMAFVAKFCLLTIVAIYYQLFNFPNLAVAMSMSCVGPQMASWFWIYTIVIDIHGAVTLVIARLITSSPHETILVSYWSRRVSNVYYALSIIAQLILCGYGLYLSFDTVTESCQDTLRISVLGVLSIDICMICIYVLSIIAHVLERYNLCFLGDDNPELNTVDINSSANSGTASLNNLDNNNNNHIILHRLVSLDVPGSIPEADAVTLRQMITEQ